MTDTALSKEIRKAQELLRNLVGLLNKGGVMSVPVQGLGLVREDLGIRLPRRKRRRRKNGTN